MQTFKQRDIMKNIDDVIDSDPLIERIRLDENETLDFLEQIPRLYNIGKLDMNTKLEKTEYFYRRVLIEVASNNKLELLIG